MSTSKLTSDPLSEGFGSRRILCSPVTSAGVNASIMGLADKIRRWYPKIARDAIGKNACFRPPKRGVFKGIVDLQAAINRYLAETNDNPQPFTWTADPDAIIEKVRRAKQALKSIH